MYYSILQLYVQSAGNVMLLLRDEYGKTVFRFRNNLMYLKSVNLFV